MPKWACRLWLEVVSVRVKRVQDISEGDAIAEGFIYAGHGDDWQRHDSFRVYWDKLNSKKHPWDSNPWVWVVEFKRTALGV